MEDRNVITPMASEALTPAELMRKHNANHKHIITDDEMRNLKVGDDAVDDKELKREMEEKEAEGINNNHENNPYDILDT